MLTISQKSCMAANLRMEERGPPIFKASDFASSSGFDLGFGSGLGMTELVALAAFVGTIFFCTVQAMVAPQRTFCSQKMD
jgi:hypothetical protein